MKEFVADRFDSRCNSLNVHAYPVAAAHDSRSEVSAMGYGEMILFIHQIGFAGISDQYVGQRKIVQQK